MLRRPFTVTAGHGESDVGATCHGHKERDLMLELRDLVATKLREKGHQVITDGGVGVNESLVKAIRLILGSAVAVEFHTNGSSNLSATGVETIALWKDRELAKALSQAIAKVLGTPVRRDAGWYPHDQATKDRGFAPGFSRNGGLIVEVFFLSNAKDLANYLGNKHQVAEAIANILIDER